MLLQRALKNLNRPAHYSEIYEQAQALSANALPFTLKSAYTRLFYLNTVRIIGNGVFALVDEALPGQVNASSGERIFSYAPTPLLPPNASTRSFFEHH